MKEHYYTQLKDLSSSLKQSRQDLSPFTKVFYCPKEKQWSTIRCGCTTKFTYAGEEKKP